MEAHHPRLKARKKRSRKMMIVYALRIMIVLMICGVLCQGAFAYVPDSEPSDRNIETEILLFQSLLLFRQILLFPKMLQFPIGLAKLFDGHSQHGIELREVNGVVVHYTGNPGTTAKQNRSYCKKLAETKGTYESILYSMVFDIIMLQSCQRQKFQINMQWN